MTGMLSRWDKIRKVLSGGDRRLAALQMRVSLLIGVLLGIVTALAQIVFDYHSQVDEIGTQLRQISSTARNSAYEAMWNLDEELAKHIVDGLFTYEPIVSVRLIDVDGLVVAERERQLSSMKMHWISSYFADEIHEINRDIRDPSKISSLPIGKLEIRASFAPVANQFIRRSLFYLMAGILRNVFFAVILFFVFFRLFTRPVLGLAKFVDDYNPRTGASGQFQIPDYLRGSEFGHLASRVETLTHDTNQFIQELHEMRTQVESVNRRLEELVAERTEALRQESLQLQQARRMAEHANQEKSRFLMNVSHELRTPLNGILGGAQIILADQAQEREDTLRFTNLINQSGETMLGIVQDLLDMSAVEVGQLQLNIKPTDPVPILRDICQNAVISAREKGINLTLHLDPQIPLLQVDGDRFRQIVSNILSNALKFSSKGNIHVCMQTPKSCETQARLTITDTGIGMSEETISRIFAPFYQQDQGTDRLVQGLGLGLSIVKVLTDAMAGTIRVSSLEGRGSEFQLTFPRAEVTDVESRIAHSDGHVVARKTAILIAEDDVQSAEILQRALQGDGYQSYIVTHGKAAVEHARRGRYDAILMDVMMPFLDGVEATRQIRSFDTRIPIIGITAALYAEQRQKFEQAGMTTIITKPLTIEHVSTIIRSTISD